MLKPPLTLGIDAGSVSTGLALLDGDGHIVKVLYQAHKGRIRESLLSLLAQVDISRIIRVGASGSAPEILRNADRFDSRIAFITAARHLHPEMDALLMIGAERFGLATFDADGEYLSYKSNTSCAAGTGNFLDQQAERLNLRSIEEFSRLAWNNQGAYPLIASRCAVFAKTDLIHAQQEGYSLGEICDGLSYGLAKNICDTVFDGLHCRYLLAAGGVALNRPVMEHISKITGLRVHTDEYAHVYGAVGAALLAAKEGRDLPQQMNQAEDLLQQSVAKPSCYYPPLKLEWSSYPDFTSLEKGKFRSERFPSMTEVETDLYHIPEAGAELILGIDIGSTSTKAVLTDQQRRVIAGFYTRTSGQPILAVQLIFEAICDLRDRHHLDFHVRRAACTGSGRKFIGTIIGADAMPDEITAHARAACELDPETDTIIEIGGQDSKFTILQQGMVTFSVMNNVCAAGTGSFIEEQARRLGVSLDEFADKAFGAQAPIASDRCTVFMERDLNNYLNSGYRTEEILAAVLHATRENYLSKVAHISGIGQKIFFQGATARNRALVAAFEQKLGKPIMVSPYCHLTGAYGAALDLMDQAATENRFRGLNLYLENIEVRSEVCNLCSNYCKLKVADVGGATEAYGFLCGRDYNMKKFVRNPGVFRLIARRQEIFRIKVNSHNSGPVLGLPAGLHLFEELPFWQKFFDLLGIRTISSEAHEDVLREGKNLSGAEFCAPLSAMHGHVASLLKHADYVFLPVYLGDKGGQGMNRQYCYYTQYIAPLITTRKQFDTQRILSPLLRTSTGSLFARTELLDTVNRISGGRHSLSEVSKAYRQAEKSMENLREKWRQQYLQFTEEQDDLHIVLLGRPYTVLSPSMNKHIPGIIEKNGISAFFMDMIQPGSRDILKTEELLRAVKWKFASRILHSAEIIARSPNAYPVLITSFKCTPDAFAVEYFKEIMQSAGKPYLILQLDEHDSTVGYETRIEAGIRAFRNHHSKSRHAQGTQKSTQTRVRIPASAKSENRSIWEKYMGSLVSEAGRLLKKDPEGFRLFSRQLQDVQALSNDFHYDMTRKPAGLKGKTLLLPCWDPCVGPLLEAVLLNSGVDARLLESSHDSMLRSLSHNTGQCLPLNMILQDSVDYIRKYDLDPAQTLVWSIESNLSCNFSMFPHYMKKLLNDQGEGMEQVGMYLGDIVFFDISLQTAINAFLAYNFGGNIRKMACMIRPYEISKGKTDQVVKESLDALYRMFREGRSKESVLEKIITAFEAIPVSGARKPKAAIFGDLYVRDNDLMNQDLIRVIEANGGEAVTTSYSEYIKIIADPFMERTYREGRYMEYVKYLFLKTLIPVFEEKYNRYFYRITGKPAVINPRVTDEWISRFGLNLLHRGESFENILKIHHLAENHPDLALFVQTNPAYCCPSLVTEAMASRIEEITGIPVVAIEYDGTTASRNDVLIPYLKYRKKRRKRDDQIA